MAYSADIKRLAMKMVYIDKCTYEHIHKTLLISERTIKNWVKLNKNNALYTIKPRSNASRKINDDSLRAYVLQNPDAYLYEVAEYLGVSTSGVHDALKRLNITYKKNTSLQGTGRRKTA